MRLIRYLVQESIHMKIAVSVCFRCMAWAHLSNTGFNCESLLEQNQMFTTAFPSQTATWVQRIELVWTPGNSIWGECLVVASRHRWLGGPTAGGQRYLVWTFYLSLPVLGIAEAVQRVNLHLKPFEQLRWAVQRLFFLLYFQTGLKKSSSW